MTPEQWLATWWPIVAPAALILLTGTVTGIWVIVNRRGADKTKAKIPLPPTWPEMWKRLDDQDTRMEAQDTKITEQATRIKYLEDCVTKLTGENTSLKAQVTDMGHHIIVLEEMVPTPPGAPPRPASWDLVVI